MMKVIEKWNDCDGIGRRMKFDLKGLFWKRQKKSDLNKHMDRV